MKRLLLFLILPLCLGQAEDVLEMKNGTRRAGGILSADEKTIRLAIEITPQGKTTLETRPTIGIPRGDVSSIIFAADPQRDAVIRSAGSADVPALESAWAKFKQWIEMPRAPAGAIGCALGNALLATKERRNAVKALELFKIVEEKAWLDSDRNKAREGRLRAMTATGQAEKAIDEAKALAAETEDPEILIEANYLMAQSANKDLREFLKENPRWEIDPNVIGERHRLHNKVLALYLYPSLFFGSNNAKAARGLWGAVGVYQLCGEQQLAIETSRDIVAFYPATPEAALAKAYLDSLKPDQLATDWEAEGKKEVQDGVSQSPPAPASTPTPEASTKPEEPAKPAKKTKKNKSTK